MEETERKTINCERHKTESGKEEMKKKRNREQGMKE
jgi:hypothetical protein